MRSKPLAECAAGLSSTRSLTVLDLAVDGENASAPRAGMFAISTAAHAITQQRAGANGDAFGDLDGVGDQSGFAADPSVALVTAADSALPMPPGVSVPLTPRQPPRRRRRAYRLPHHLTVFLQTHAHSPGPGNR